MAASGKKSLGQAIDAILDGTFGKKEAENIIWG